MTTIWIFGRSEKAGLFHRTVPFLIAKKIQPNVFFVRPIGLVCVYIGVDTHYRKKGLVMNDAQIIDLYFDRSEAAIQETDRKYGGYCYHIAYSILANREDSDESVSDTYFSAWNPIPPQKPVRFSLFLGKLTRNISIDRWRRTNAKKRGNGEFLTALEELGDCVSGSPSPEDAFLEKEVMECLNFFLGTLSEAERTVFLCRYWYMNSVEKISKKTGFSPSKVKSMLARTRGKLGKYLEKEGLR